MNEEQTLQDGIYFHMPEDQYHALERLSASGIKSLMISPLQYYTENFDESFVRRESVFMVKGKAYHKRILEGQDAFSDAYVKRLEKSDIDGVLDTQADLKEWCKYHGLAVSGTKPALTERIIDAAPEMASKIFELALQSHNQRYQRQVHIASEDMIEIERAATIMESSDLAMLFSNGIPEVSILWTDEVSGVQCKARIDYLKTKQIVDLKTFSNSKRKPIHSCVSQAIAYEKYNIQAVHYSQGLQAVIKLINDGKAHIDDNENNDFIQQLILNSQEFVFVFQETGQVNNCAARKFCKKTSGMKNNYWYSTEDILLDMRVKYSEFMKSHGRNKAWYEHLGVEDFDDSDFPLWMFSDTIA